MRGNVEDAVSYVVDDMETDDAMQEDCYYKLWTMSMSMNSRESEFFPQIPETNRVAPGCQRSRHVIF